MRRVLFVDDDPNVRDGLRRTLWPLRKSWEVRFAASGSEALGILESEPFDVIVTDMRMPGIDGAALLREVHRRFPGVVRFVLSGHAELQGVVAALPFAHQFLSKPCDASTLREAIERAIALEETMSQPGLRALVAEVAALPARPETYAAIVERMADPDVEMCEVAEIVESDPVVAAKLLQLVNSAFFGLSQRIADVRQATSYLGLSGVRDLALAVEVFRFPAGASPRLRSFVGEVQSVSLKVASIARSIATDKAESSTAFTAGLLHEVGALALAVAAPERLEAVLERAGGDVPLEQAEKEFLGVTHADVGAYLLGLWGLPYPVVEATAYHHRPADLPEQEAPTALTAVHVANALVRAQMPAESILAAGAGVNLAYLEALGIADCLPEWEERVAGYQGEEPR